ncbi:DNA/RNA non-specific endonuclease [Flavobacterium jejuense]|uniref:DNA/RNA non-specific endonuclease n=1 Tax=Flavobacterium jejuense TaxID=1544455 RepID=A0ABX0IVW2_9FLAO|nr:DNA/RNA non-specific endonuclease [Flavobacterium jejuense]NHN26668.1 DNA/RNA non-specific endonuclease [Flavobacterium jejuense]
MYSVRISFLIILIFCLSSCRDNGVGQTLPEIINDDVLNSVGEFNYLPSNTTGAVYKKRTYALSYSEEYEQAEWVAYVLKSSDIKEVDFKRPYFEIDTDILTGAAHWRNYKKSGYNKGHLCPAGDRRSNLKDYEETFLTSNISPQKYDFNAGIWNRLEQKVRYWAKKQDSIYVVSGGVLTDDLETIGFENVAVPKYFYKILLSNDHKKMIGFLVPHQKSDKPLYSFITSVDEIEKMTDIDFFPSLDDDLENRLESNINYDNWDF